MLVTVETQNKKCIVETEYWYAWKDDIKEDLIEMSFTEEEFTELPDKLTLTTSDVYRWGHITVDMPYQDYEQMDWQGNDEWNATHYSREDWSFSDGTGNDYDFNFDMGEDVTEYEVYDLIREKGDVDDSEVALIGPLTATVDDEDVE